MKGLTKRWQTPPAAPAEGNLRHRILSARGLIQKEEIQAFLGPDLKAVTESAPLAGMDQAAEVILATLEAKQPLVIYGDYDVDGITATAILWHVFHGIDPEASVSSYVPHRLEEGYGLNAEAVRALADEGAATIVTVDCGVTALEEAALARELGVQMIITDHHRVRDDGQLPDAAAIVHPSLPGQEHDFIDLAGAGVAWKLALHVARRSCGRDEVTPKLRQILMNGLSLAAMGTIADVVPLRGENRAIAYFGLRHMANCDNVGLKALLAASGSRSANDAEVVGFRLGPRLNASGRMGHAASAIELFTTADATRSRELASELSKLNTSRQEVERGILEQAREAAKASGMTEPGSHAIVLRHPDWHPGVVGIVCSRLVEEFGRPTILMQDDGEVCRGSGRSIAGYSMHEALWHCEDHLLTFGGHDFAAGMKLSSSQFDQFAEAMVAHATANIPAENLMPQLNIDAEATRPEINMTMVKSLADLKPFGRSNPAPRVLLRDMKIVSAKPFGKQNNHLRLQLESPERGGTYLNAIWWGKASLGKSATNRRVDVVGKPEIDDYRKTEHLVIEDMAWLEVQ